jgi:hypothetical protein
MTIKLILEFIVLIGALSGNKKVGLKAGKSSACGC